MYILCATLWVFSKSDLIWKLYSCAICSYITDKYIFFWEVSLPVKTWRYDTKASHKLSTSFICIPVWLGIVVVYGLVLRFESRYVCLPYDLAVLLIIIQGFVMVWIYCRKEQFPYRESGFRGNIILPKCPKVFICNSQK